MKRRDFIVAVVGSTASWPAMAANEPVLPTVGWLSLPPKAANVRLPVFKDALASLGFIEGKTVAYDYGFAEGHIEKLAGAAAELVQRRVAVIASPSGLPAARAAKAATTIIPIVFLIGDDPVETGLVESINRPGANLTGLRRATRSWS
jgi:putative tryptophan/tyrosine transport system substrate-binding protein